MSKTVQTASRKPGQIYIGVGGWTFEPWRGVFYPEKLTQAKELAYAASKLTSIEINGTYYGSQKPESFRKWAREVPDGFVFSLKGPRFATNRQRMQNRAALEAEMEAVLATGTTEHWVGVLEAAGVPCGPVYNYGQMFADPQVKHRGMVQYAKDAEFGEVPHIRTPVKIGDSVRVRSVAPKLGQHNAEIFGRLGLNAADLAALRDKGVL